MSHYTYCPKCRSESLDVDTFSCDECRFSIHDAMRDTERLNLLEKAVEEGSCPGIINSDNGYWAVTGDGMQNAPFGDEPQDIQTTFFVEAAQWRDTIREAIDAYLTDPDRLPPSEPER